jgi:ankyrin repeat protein
MNFNLYLFLFYYCLYFCYLGEALLLGDSNKKSRPNVSNSVNREMFIRGKYELKSFLGPHEKNESLLNTMLFEAIKNAQLIDVVKLIAWGAKTTWPNETEDNRTALHQSVMYGSIVIVECIIQNTNELNPKELRGWTPLHCK